MPPTPRKSPSQRNEPTLDGVLFVAWAFPDPKRPNALAWLEAVDRLGGGARLLAAAPAAMAEPAARNRRAGIAARTQYLVGHGRALDTAHAFPGVRYVHAIELAALPLARSLAAKLRVPFGFDCDALALARLPNELGTEALEAARLVLTDTAHVVRRLHARAPGAVIELSRRGVELRRMATPSEPPRAGTELLALSPLTHEAGVHRLLEGFAIARARGLSARLTIAGEGPMQASLMRLVAALRLEPSVRLVPPAPLLEASALRSADALVAPALSEASVHGAALEAAFASGRPVIASDVPTHRELLQPDAAEPNGWLVARDDPRALAAAIELSCTDPLGARRRGRQARRFAERVLDLERNACARAERLFAAAHSGLVPALDPAVDPALDPRVSCAEREPARSWS